MVEITVDATMDNVIVVTEFVEKELESLNCPMKIQSQINIVVDEMFANIAGYAYPDKDGKATIRFDVEGDRIRLAFIDQGIAYNPLEKADPNVDEMVHEDVVGGLGIYMVKQMMDEITYEYKDGSNVTTVWKKYAAE